MNDFMRDLRRWMDDNAQALQSLLGLLRLFTVPALIIAVAWVGGNVFESVDAQEFGNYIRSINPFFRRVPDFLIYLFHGRVVRYMVIPIVATFAVLLASANYVRDIYALPGMTHAFHYILNSLFGIRRPTIEISGGRIDQNDPDWELFFRIGGPGNVVVQPGNAVLFQKIHCISFTSVNQSYFLSPFETIGPVINLDDQDERLDDFAAQTLDGIRVRLRDIRFRYRILAQTIDQRVVRRSLDAPYPFDSNAIHQIPAQLIVSAEGLNHWHQTVALQVRNSLTGFVNQHTLDYLTAPRTSPDNPQEKLRQHLTSAAAAARLRDLGAELIWIDVGFIEMVDEEVNQERLNNWAVEWRANAGLLQAYSQAMRQGYAEVSQAEAEAAVIRQLVEGLGDIQPNTTPENLRTLFLLRSAQILDNLERHPYNNGDNGGLQPPRQEPQAPA